MSDRMTFPDTAEEFMEQYKVVDTDHVYSNGVEFVPIFRMKQWFEHLAQPEQKWIPCSERLPEENGLYLVTVNASKRPVRIYEYTPWEMSEERKYWINDCDNHSHVFNHFVKAWMPLTEPYKGEQK